MTRNDPCVDGEGRPDFVAVFENSRPQLLALARRLTRSESEAEDIVQQAFVNGLKAADRFAGRAQVSSWMYRITYNTALMSLRSKRRKPTESLDALTEKGAAPASTVRETPTRGMTLKNVKVALGAALSQLNPVDRKIVALRLYEGWSTQAVAAELGLTPSATKTRLHRARGQLKELLDDDLLDAANAVAA